MTVAADLKIVIVVKSVAWLSLSTWLSGSCLGDTIAADNRCPKTPSLVFSDPTYKVAPDTCPDILSSLDLALTWRCLFRALSGYFNTSFGWKFLIVLWTLMHVLSLFEHLHLFRVSCLSGSRCSTSVALFKRLPLIRWLVLWRWQLPRIGR